MVFGSGRWGRPALEPYEMQGMPYIFDLGVGGEVFGDGVGWGDRGIDISIWGQV